MISRVANVYRSSSRRQLAFRERLSGEVFPELLPNPIGLLKGKETTHYEIASIAQRTKRYIFFAADARPCLINFYDWRGSLSSLQEAVALNEHMSNPNTEVEASEGQTRRAFYLAAIYALGGIISLALAIPTAIYLLVAPRPRGDAGWIDAGDITQLTPGMPMSVSFEQNRMDGWRLDTEQKTAWVVKTPDNKVLAFGPQCTHLACAYHWETSESKFVCPCHGSEFSIDGKVLAGPASRPLDQYQTKIENNRLQIGQLRQSGTQA
jgi:menaquinol-cytochrome c reductase iron-sulfur subunit